MKIERQFGGDKWGEKPEHYDSDDYGEWDAANFPGSRRELGGFKRTMFQEAVNQGAMRVVQYLVSSAGRPPTRQYRSQRERSLVLPP